MNYLKLAPLNTHICNHSLHTGNSIYFDADKGADWVDIKRAGLGLSSLQELKHDKFTGIANFVLNQRFDLRIAPEQTARLKECGLAINGHEHLSKNDENEQEAVFGAGQAYFEKGRLTAINNNAPAFCPPGLGESGGLQYMQQLQEGFETAGGRSLSGVSYESFNYETQETQKAQFA